MSIFGIYNTWVNFIMSWFCYLKPKGKVWAMKSLFIIIFLIQWMMCLMYVFVFWEPLGGGLRFNWVTWVFKKVESLWVDYVETNELIVISFNLWFRCYKYPSLSSSNFRLSILLPSGNGYVIWVFCKSWSYLQILLCIEKFW